MVDVTMTSDVQQGDAGRDSDDGPRHITGTTSAWITWHCDSTEWGAACTKKMAQDGPRAPSGKPNGRVPGEV